MSSPKRYDSRPDTRQHIARVQWFIEAAIFNLRTRAVQHDRSKLQEPELEGWDIGTPKLASLTYGTDEYRESLRELKPTIEHHYAHNDHHPEYHEDGVAGMSLTSLIEMLCDWRAASERTAQTKSFAEGLDHNFERFGIEPQLASIIRNTVQELGL